MGTKKEKPALLYYAFGFVIVMGILGYLFAYNKEGEINKGFIAISSVIIVVAIGTLWMKSKK